MNAKLRLARRVQRLLFQLIWVAVCRSQEFQVLPHCDEYRFPTSNSRGLIEGTRGCSGEPELLGSWFVEVIKDGRVVATEPIPFAWDNHAIVDRHIVGVYAKHLVTGQEQYLKIPQRYWESPPDPSCGYSSSIYFAHESGIAITCQLPGRHGYIYWQFDQGPQLLELNEIEQPPTPKRLPLDDSAQLQFRHVSGRWVHADLPNDQRIEVTRASAGGYFVVGLRRRMIEFCGLTTPDGTRWQWQHVVKADDQAEAILPEGLSILNQMIYVERSRGSSSTKLQIATAVGIETAIEFSSGLVSSLNLSPDQRLGIIQSMVLSERTLPIDQAYEGKLLDLQSLSVVRKLPLPEIVVFGIYNQAQLLVRGAKTQFALVEKQGQASKVVQEFDVLKLPPN